MSNTITFTSHIHQVLFANEISGQMSDGYWENAKPLDHWKLPCNADVVLGDVANVNFYVSKRYNFAAKALLDVVSDRMITFAKMAIKFPELSSRAIRLADYGSWIWDRNDYFEEKAELAKLGIVDATTFQQVIDSLDVVSYTFKDLKKDLKEMQTPFENQYLKTHG
jgi:hypothetical protein